jgi:hypothetical protein
VYLIHQGAETGILAVAAVVVIVVVIVVAVVVVIIAAAIHLRPVKTTVTVVAIAIAPQAVVVLGRLLCQVIPLLVKAAPVTVVIALKVDINVKR